MPSSKPITRAWTVPASGSNTIMEIVGVPEYLWVTYISARAHRDNAGDVTWQDPGGQTGGFIGPGEAAFLGNDYGSAQMTGFTFSGTADDVLYMTVGISLGDGVE